MALTGKRNRMKLKEKAIVIPQSSGSMILGLVDDGMLILLNIHGKVHTLLLIIIQLLILIPQEQKQVILTDMIKAVPKCYLKWL